MSRSSTARARAAPTTKARSAELDKAVKAGIKVVLIDNDIPGWNGKSSGSLGIDTAVKAARGETVPANVDTGTQVVTQDNVSQFS